MTERQRATFTRQTDEHLWFRFAQEGEDSAEGYVKRRHATANEDDPTIVRSFDSGLWFVNDATSIKLTLPTPPAPPALRIIARSGRAITLGWDPPDRFARYDLVVRYVTRSRTFKYPGVPSDTGRQGVFLPRLSPGTYTARLEERGVPGPTLTWTMGSEAGPSEGFPPNVDVTVGERVDGTDTRRVVFSWFEPSNFLTRYDIQLRRTIDQGWSVLVTGISSGTSLIPESYETTLAPGEYQVRLRSTEELLLGDPTTFIVGDFVPFPPILSARVVRDSVQLSWAPPAVARDSYEVRISGPDVRSSFRTVATLGSQAGGHLERGLAPGLYYAHIRDGSRTSLRDTPFTIFPQTSEPPVLQAEVLADRFVRFTWAPTVGGETYELVVTKGGRGVVILRVRGSDGLRLHQFAEDGTYSARLDDTVTGAIGQTTGFVIDTTRPPPPPPPPPRPPALTAEITGLRVKLSWVPPSVTARYDLQVTGANNTNFATRASNMLSSDGFRTISVPVEGDYRARLVDTDTGVRGPVLRFTVGTPLPTPPRLRVSNTGLDIVLSWTPPSTATTYNVQLTAVNSIAFGNIATNVASSTGSVSHTVPSAGTYIARLVDRNTPGPETTFTITVEVTPETPETPGTPEPRLPDIPDLRASPSGLDVLFTWDAPDVSRRYDIEIAGPGVGEFNIVARDIPSSRERHPETLTQAGTYRARLRDGARAGNSVSFTLEEPVEPPSEVPRLRVSVDGRTAFLTWTRTGEPDTYTVELTTVNTSRFGTQASGIPSGRGRHTITGLASGSYMARLVADDGTVGVATPFDVAPRPPSPPDLRATVTGLNVLLQWSAPRQATTYSVQLRSPGSSVFRTISTRPVESGSELYNFAVPSAGVYAARLVDRGVNGGAVTFLVVDEPPALRATVEAVTVRLRWNIPASQRFFQLWMTDPDSDTLKLVEQLSRVDSKLGLASVSILPGHTYRAQLRDGETEGPILVFRTPPALDVDVDDRRARFFWGANPPESAYDIRIGSPDDNAFSRVVNGVSSGGQRRHFESLPGIGRYSAALYGEDGYGPGVKFNVFDPPELTAMDEDVTFEWPLQEVYDPYELIITKFGTTTVLRRSGLLAGRNSSTTIRDLSSGAYFVYLEGRKSTSGGTTVVVPSVLTPRVINRRVNFTFETFGQRRVFYRAVVISASSLTFQATEIVLPDRGNNAGVAGFNLVDLADTYGAYLELLDPDTGQPTGFYGPGVSFNTLPAINGIRTDVGTAAIAAIALLVGPPIGAAGKALLTARNTGRKAAERLTRLTLRGRGATPVKKFGAKFLIPSANASASKGIATAVAQQAASSAAVAGAAGQIAALVTAAISGGGLIAFLTAAVTAVWAKPELPQEFEIVLWDKTDAEEIARKRVKSEEGLLSTSLIGLPGRYGTVDRLHEMQIWAEDATGRGPISDVTDILIN